MRAEGTFTVASFVPAQVEPPPVAVEVGIPVGTAVMEKVYDGDVSGRSATIFTSAFDMGTGMGTYVALETFEGRLGDRTGGFAYVHSATTTGFGPAVRAVRHRPGQRRRRPGRHLRRWRDVRRRATTPTGSGSTTS